MREMIIHNIHSHCISYLWNKCRIWGSPAVGNKAHTALNPVSGSQLLRKLEGIACPEYVVLAYDLADWGRSRNCSTMALLLWRSPEEFPTLEVLARPPLLGPGVGSSFWWWWVSIELNNFVPEKPALFSVACSEDVPRMTCCCSFLKFLGAGIGEGAIRGEPPSRGDEPLRFKANPRRLGTGLDQRLPPVSYEHTRERNTIMKYHLIIRDIINRQVR